MRVLVPLPFDVSHMAHGRNLRIVHLLRGLSRGCELTCITADETAAERARSVLPDLQIVPADSAVAPRAGSAGMDSLGRLPWLLRRAIEFLGYDHRLLAEVQARASGAEVILGFDMPSVVYLLAADGRLEGRPRTVCDLIDDPWLSWRSLSIAERFGPAGLKTAACIRLIRRHSLSKLDALTAVAPRDAASLSQAAGMEVAVVPNGTAVPDGPEEVRDREPLVVFTGAMNFGPNESAACWMVRRVWPRVLRRLRGSSACSYGNGSGDGVVPTLAIVGANPTRRVQRLSKHPGVLVTGRVEDVSSWLKRARVAVAPMVSGCGMKNKILEACAAGCPVVTTPLGAAGLPTGGQCGIIVAESAQQVAEEAARMLMDDRAARMIGAAGRTMVRQRFSWSNSTAALLAVLHGNARAICSEAGRTPRDDEPAATQTVPARHEGQPDQEALIHAVSAAS